jgi:Transposase domain (DUF772)
MQVSRGCSISRRVGGVVGGRKSAGAVGGGGRLPAVPAGAGVALARSDRAKGGRPRCSWSRSWCCRTLYRLSDGEAEYQFRDRLPFIRFVGLGLGDRVPDAKTLWPFCEQLTRVGAIERLFGKFDTMLRDACSLFSNVSNDSHPCHRI